MQYEVEDSRPRARPKRIWIGIRVVQKDNKAHGLSREDAMNRGRWEEEADKGRMMISCVNG